MSARQRKRNRKTAHNQRRLENLLADPKGAFKQREMRRATLCRELFDRCAEQITANPTEGKRLAKVAVAFARLLGDRCLVAKAFGILASAHRALGALGKAESSLRVAFDKSCKYCAADLHRRLAYVRQAQERYADAFQEIECAIELYQALADDDGVGRALICRGTIHFRVDDIHSAVSDMAKALTLISLERSSLYHRAAVYNLTLALAVGKMVDAETALKKLKKVTSLFTGLRGFTAERAKLRWLEGIIMMQLGCDQRAEGLLRTARDSLIELKMPQEVAAITADLALFCHTDRRAVRSLARETVKLDWAVAHKDIGPKIVAFARETTAKDVSAAQLRAAAKSLRQAVGECGIAAPGFA